MDDNRFIITINRECGTDGRAIALQLGQLLGVKVYDRAILAELTEKFHLTVEEIERLKAKKTYWWNDFVNFYKQFNALFDSTVDEDRRVTSAEIYHAEAKILRGLAEQESCVIIGRSGFHIFRDDPHAMKILIIADQQSRVKRYAAKYGKTDEEALRIINKVDREREAYTKTFAGSSRYDARNYDLVCNVSNYQTEHVAGFLADVIRRRFRIAQ